MATVCAGLQLGYSSLTGRRPIVCQVVSSAVSGMRVIRDGVDTSLFKWSRSRMFSMYNVRSMGFAVRVRSAGQKYWPTCHQRDRADVTEFVTLVRLSSLGQHVGVLALAGYKRRKSALTATPIDYDDDDDNHDGGEDDDNDDDNNDYEDGHDGMVIIMPTVMTMTI